MNDKKIIGICLVKNDDRFFNQAIENIVDFCDELIIADHLSKDGTADIAKKWAKEYSHITYHRIQNPSESHELIRPYCSKKAWVFAVDGDEIYEKSRLALFRKQLLSGKFDDIWQILGKVLHCDEYQDNKQLAFGYLARPSRSMTKLYNFEMIKDWKGPCSERLHHGEIIFKSGITTGEKDHSESEMNWESAVFRCLHMVFLRRSSLQKDEDISRPNIAEKNAFSKIQKIKYILMNLIGKEPLSKTKHLTYMRGDRVSIDVTEFFNR